MLVVLGLGAWRRRADRDVAALAAALAGYSVWVFFNFDWSPATGAFWLLAGTLWSSIHLPIHGEVAAKPPEGQGRSYPWRPVVAVALVAAAVAFAVFPILADTWYLRGRSDLSVKVDPLQAQYNWALGEGQLASGDLGGGVAEMRRAADLGETEPAFYVELGDRELQLGDRTQARRDYERALSRSTPSTPQPPSACRRLAKQGMKLRAFGT